MSTLVARGFALGEDLPLLSGQEFLPHEKDAAVGAVDDARPDRWGERVIGFIDKPPRLSLLEYLYFAGDERFGALGVSTSDEQYLPRRLGPLPTLADTEAIAELVRKVAANEPVAPELKRLIAPGVTRAVREGGLVRYRRGVWLPRARAVAKAARCRGGRPQRGADAGAVPAHGLQHSDRQHG